MSWFIPGLGMFCEAYFVFSIGNIGPFFPYEYPKCWKDYKTCNKTTTQVPSYVQIIGIIFGMCTLGYLGDKIGREDFPFDSVNYGDLPILLAYFACVMFTTHSRMSECLPRVCT